MNDPKNFIWRVTFILLAVFGLTSFVAWSGRAFDGARANGPRAGESDTKAASTVAADSQLRAHLEEAYGRRPLSFEANRGQTDARVAFISRSSGATLFLTADEAVLALRKPAARDKRRAAAVHMQMVNANPAARPEGLDQLDATSNYFKGRDAGRWRTNIPTYARVRYRDVYPGVSLVYYGNQQQLEYDFVVSPGGDPRQIKLAFKGSRPLHVNADGDLVLRVAGGEMRFHKPTVYQEIDGSKQTVAARYRLKGRYTVGFEAAAYDHRKPLVIDPIFSYSTYLGGTGSDQGNSIVVDSTGNAYVTGQTLSLNFPTSGGAYDTTFAGSYDVFVTKMNASGSALVYSTYLGGASGDLGFGIVIDDAGNAYVTGATSSNDFPTTPGAYQTVLQGGSFPGDAFITKLNSTGTALIYSTYLGGATSDQGSGIAIDSAGDAYVTGYTLSGNFPTTPGAFQTTYGGNGDAFVSELNSAGTALIYSTYLGGADPDTANGIKVDASNQAYVTGVTKSSNFPTTPGAFQTAYGGALGTYNQLGDAFVSKLNSAGTGLVYSTYLGGSADDGAYGIDLSASGEVYLAGQTNSADFPTTAGVVRVTNGGVAKTTSGGASWAAAHAGIDSPNVQSLAIHPSNPAIVYAGAWLYGDVGGVYKSTDGGTSWSAMNSGLTFPSALALAIDPGSPSTIYLGLALSGVFKSTDGGASWQAINTGEDGTRVNSLKLDPTNSSTVYAGTNMGVFKTTNGGASWAARNTGLGQAPNVNAIAIDPSSPATLYAGMDFGTLYKSTNSGANWSRTSLTSSGVQALTINPSAPSTVYAATRSGLFKSTDGGASWNASNTGLTSQFVNAVVLSPANPATLYAGTGDGAFRSTDGGGTWTPAGSGLISATVNVLAIDPTTPATIYAGSSYDNLDAFVTKLNAAGTALLYSTYLGGFNSDVAAAVAADSQGNAYVTGSTGSSNFPTTPGGLPVQHNGVGFVTKLNPTASAVIYSSSLAGSTVTGGDECLGIAVDASASAYVTGSAFSQDFPVTPGAFQTTFAGDSGSDAFVSKFTATPSRTSDLSVAVAASGGPPFKVGGELVYDITVTNNGPERAVSVVVNDDLPPSVGVISCNSCSQTGNSVSFLLDALDPGRSATMRIRSVVSCSLPNNTLIENTATVTTFGDPNPGNNSATMTVNAVNPTTSLTPPSQAFPVGGGNGSVSVNRGAFCGWTAVSNASWITVTFSSGCCDGSIGYTVAANNGAARAGTITIAGKTFIVTQAGTCSAAPTTGSANFDRHGGASAVAVAAAPGCTWMASSNDSWITITAGSSGTGNGTVSYSVAANPSSAPRTGSMFIAGQTFLVNQGGGPVKLDLEGDQKTDIAYYRDGLWAFLRSSQIYDTGNAQFFSWGGAGLQPIIADFDGDGKVDIGYIVPPSSGQSATYAILLSSHNYSFQPGQALFVPAGFPSVGDTPVVGDFDGDGKADPGIWRSSSGVWIIPKSSANYASFLFTQWGQSGDTPVVGDIDNDGKADFGYYRDGVWGFLQSSQGYSFGSARFFSWGGAGLQPIVADFDGDGRSDLTYIAPPSGGQSATYAILLSSTNYSFQPGQTLFVPAGFPVLGDTPVVADYDGDGKADPGIWRASQGVWIIPTSSSNYTQFIFKQWGQSLDVPMPHSLNQQ